MTQAKCLCLQMFFFFVVQEDAERCYCFHLIYSFQLFGLLVGTLFKHYEQDEDERLLENTKTMHMLDFQNIFSAPTFIE